MKNVSPANPRFLLSFFRLFGLVGAVPFLINTADILLHPFAPTLPLQTGPGERLLLGLLAAPLTMAIAVMCIRRAPTNLIGWQLVVFSYGISVQVMRVDLFPLPLTLGLANVLISQFWIAFLLIPLYFPDGRLFPAFVNRWGNPIISLILVFLLVTVIFSPQFSWGEISELSVPNPLFVVEWDYTAVTRPLIQILLLSGITSVVFRYRGSRELERLQLRWLFFSMLLLGLFTLIVFQDLLDSPVLDSLMMLSYNLIIPFAVGIAVLRYRLYDIDLIIRRTLQYGLLSLLLGLVYFGLVILLGQAFQGVTRQQSPLVIVVSTLAIAALFNPLRRRVQAWIDKRFFRQRYNADQAVESFAAAARAQVALGALANRLAETARESLQPEDVWVWIRKEARPDLRENRGEQ